MSKENTASGGIGFFGLLGILFIGLKLTNYINWSWALVLLPLYGPIVLFLVVALFLFVISLCVANWS